MDAAKKTALEKRIVMGLAGVFVVTLFFGPLRSLGVFARPAPGGGAGPSSEAVSVSPPGGTMSRQNLEEAGQPVEAQQPGRPARAASGSPRYTAQHLRDPLESRFPTPEPEQPPVVPPDAQAASATSSPEANPPVPALRIQGILWGGAEPQAIINDRVYKIDDRVEGGKILAITGDGVTIEYGAARVYFQLPPLTSGRASSSQSPQGR